MVRETFQIERPIVSQYFISVSLSPSFWDVWGSLQYICLHSECFPSFHSHSCRWCVSLNCDQWSATANFTFIQHLTISLLLFVPTKMPQTHFSESRRRCDFRELSMRRNISCVLKILLYYSKITPLGLDNIVQIYI